MAKLEQVSGRYGAPMGRASAPPGTDPHCIIRVRRLRLNSGGYDSGGAYWGHGAPLWHASGIDEFEGSFADVSDFYRAPDKAAAIGCNALGIMAGHCAVARSKQSANSRELER